MALNVTTPHAFNIRAVPTNPVPVNTSPHAVILVPVPGGQGPPGVSGGGTIQLVTSAALSGHRLVIPDDSGQLAYADATNIAHATRPIWLTTSAWGSGVLATVVAEGPVTEPTWNWTIGAPIYLGTNGGLTQTIPPGAAFVLMVAEVITPTTLAFRPGTPIITA